MQPPKKALITFLILLLMAGLGIAAYQHYRLGIPIRPQNHHPVWKLSMRIITETPPGKPLKMTLRLPRLADSQRLEESLSAGDFGKDFITDNHNRSVILSINRANKYHTVLYNLVMPAKAESRPPVVPDVEKEINSLGNRLPTARFTLLQELAENVKSRAADPQSLARQAILSVHNMAYDKLKSLLDKDKPATLTRAIIASHLMSLNGLPNVIMHVLPYQHLSNISTATLPVWLGVYIDGKWHYYNMKDASPVSPSDGLVLWQGENGLVQMSAGHATITDFSLSPQQLSPMQFQHMKNHRMASTLYTYSLQNLPARTQETYRIILLMPLGVLVMLLLRIVVGISTLGTFMPVLVALAFRDTTLIWGTVFFSLVVMIGLSVRRFLESLHLLVVPRLGIMLTTVVLLLAGISIITHKLGLENGLTVGLFPMVILTMTIERLAILWEERGAGESLYTAAGSLVSAAIIYLLVFNHITAHLFFSFPSLLLIVMAAMLLLGRYHGYRLSELWRFRELAHPDRK